MYSHILIPTDGSELSFQAIRHGVDLAAEHEARVTLLHCSLPFAVFDADSLLGMPREQYETLAGSAARRILAAGEDYARARSVPVESEHVHAQHPYESIVDTAAKLGCDLIVMASHGRKGAASYLIGSETLKVLTHTRIPVLVCR